LFSLDPDLGINPNNGMSAEHRDDEGELWPKLLVVAVKLAQF
jgi:hypothetical protein